MKKRPNIIRWRDGWVTEMQQCYIKAIEQCPGVSCIGQYDGKSTRDASKWISLHEDEYNEYQKEESALDAAYGIGQE